MSHEKIGNVNTKINPVNLTIIMCTYNRADLLETNVKKLLSSKYDFELLIYNDASSDNTDEIVNKITDSRINYVKNIVNKGYAHNLNKGIEIAKNDYVFLCEDDAFIVDPDKFISIIIRELESNNIIGTHIIPKYNKLKNKLVRCAMIWLEPFTKDIVLYNGKERKIVPFCNNCFGFNKHLNPIRFDEIRFRKIAHRIESDFQMRAKKQGFKIIYNPQLKINHLNYKKGGLPTNRLYSIMLNHVFFLKKYFSFYNVLLFEIVSVFSHPLNLSIIHKVLVDSKESN